MAGPEGESFELEIVTRMKATITPERYQELLNNFREEAQGEVTVELIPDNGEAVLFELPPVILDESMVTLHGFKRFQRHEFKDKDEAVSSLATRIFKRMVRQVPQDALKTDGKGNIVGIEKAAAKVALLGITGKKSRDFVKQYQERYLPETE